MRSLIGAGAAALALLVYLGSGDSGGEGTAQASGVSAPVSVAPAAAPEPEVEAEPSAWEKEQQMLKEAGRLDTAAQAQADTFGAILAGESKPKATTSAPTKRTWKPKAKKQAAPKKDAVSEYDPMNGSL